jgi:membrane protease YdiL (CAAX protease family)
MPGFGMSVAVPLRVVALLVFAALHLWHHPPAIAAAVFPVSLVYGRAREPSGRTWPAAVLHVYFNLLLCASSALLCRRPMSRRVTAAPAPRPMARAPAGCRA